MKYVGSKNRYAKEILPIILKDRTDQIYIEPFVGGANTIDKVSGPRIGADINPYLIAMFRALQDGWVPPDSISETEYRDIRDNKQSYDPSLVGFVGFGCSFSGKWFGGYARGDGAKGARNYCAESKRNLLKQLPSIQNVHFVISDYINLYIPYNSIVYCDPPYRNAEKYIDGINHDDFWHWVRKISQTSKVFVSEYTAPDDFECVWSKEVYNTLDLNTGAKRGIEKLFVHR